MPLLSARQPLRERVAALSSREQSLALTVLAAVIYFGADAWVLSPQLAQQQALLDAQSATQAQVIAARVQLNSLQATSAERTQRHQAETDPLRAQLALIDRVSASVLATQPALNTLVGEVLTAQHPGVTLTRLKTLPVKPLLPSTALGKGDQGGKKDKGDKAHARLYRHGVEIEVRGRYLDLLAYAQSLESQAPDVLWSDMQLSTLTYPQSSLRFTLYSVSAQARLRLS